MLKNYLVIIVLLSFSYLNGQNLVMNGDFEQYKGCPTNYAQFDSVTAWTNPQVFPGPGGSPDYFNSCTASNYIDVPDNYWGYQHAHSGNGYAGFIPWFINPAGFREYLEAPLTTALVPGACYYFEMYIALGDICRYTSDDFGVYFSNSLVSGISNNQPLPYAPQLVNNLGFITDTAGWTKFSSFYVASGGEQFLIIGNFNNDANTDTMLCNPNGYYEPYFYVDDVSLSPCTGFYSEPNESSFISIGSDPLSSALHVTISKPGNYQLRIYDMLSRQILNKQISGTDMLNVYNYENGMYVYQILQHDSVIKSGRLIILK